MAKKYKGSIKLPAGLAKMGTGDYKLVDSRDVYFDNSKASKIQADNVQDALDAIYGTIHSQPILSYVNEEGYREGDVKYWNLNDDMYLKFNATIPSGTMNVTILRNGVLYLTQNMSSQTPAIIDLGKATKEDNYLYDISAVSVLGEAADEVLHFRQIIGSLQIDSNFDTKSIRKSGTTNDINVPFTLSYNSVVAKLALTATIYFGDTVINSRRVEATNTSSFSGVIDFANQYLSLPGTYSVYLYGEAIDSSGTAVSSTDATFKFTALENNTVAAILVDTNMVDIIGSDKSLYIKYRAETNIESFLPAGSLQADCIIYKIVDGHKQEHKRFTNTGLTSGYEYLTNIGRLEGLGEDGVQDYSYEVKVYNPNVDPSQYNVQTIEDNFGVQAVSSTNPISNDEFTFFASAPDPLRQSNTTWYSQSYLGPGSTGNSYYEVRLENINGKTSGFIEDDRGFENWGNQLKLNGNAYGKIWKFDANTGQYSLFHPFTNIADDDNNGLTFEIVINTKNVGIKDAIALGCANAKIEDKLGLKINYDTLSLLATTGSCSTAFVDDTWTHIAFVVNKIINTPQEIGLSDIENLNPVKTLNIYINGIRSAVQVLNDADIVKNNNNNVCLNADEDSNGELVSTGGETGIKLIRFYKRPLTSVEVLQNYISSIDYAVEQKKVLDKNSLLSTPIPVLYMIRNTWLDTSANHTYADSSKNAVNSSDPNHYRSRYDNKAMNETTFDELNHITDKAVSKSTRTNCTVWYVYYETNPETGVAEQKIRKWDDVDVFLQGTSSLEYPVKNYKFKIYDTETSVSELEPYHGSRKYSSGKGKKLKTIPFSKTVKKSGKDAGIDGWYVKDNTFTLKCDYMEQSHKNNTPTAMFYETVVDQINTEEASINKYTIGKDPNTIKNYSTVDPVTEEVSRNNRDAIHGFPILLYYDENNTPATDVNVDRIGSDGKFIVPSSVEYVGSYMFNTDKGSNSLAFEISTEENEDILPTTTRFEKDGSDKFIFDGLIRKEDNKYYVTDPMDLDKPINQRRIFKDKDNNDLSIPCLPCTSMEGKSNTAGASAATWYTLHEANESNYKSYIERKYYTDLTEILDSASFDSQNYAVKENSYLYLIWNNGSYNYYKNLYNNNFEAFRSDAYLGKLETLPSGAPAGTPVVYGFETFLDNAKQYTLRALLNNDTIWNAFALDGDAASIKVYSLIYDYEQKEETSYYNARYTYQPATGDWNTALVLDTDDYEYIGRTFEVRWAFSEEADLSGDISDDVKNELDFNAILYTLNWFKSIADTPESDRKNKFRSEFSKHFNYPYALAYYLQMMAFIQVDNAGKNAMFDQWGDGIWYVRPYDMDTQMGLDNSGLNTIEVGAELNPALSPTSTKNITWSTQPTWSTSARVTKMYNTPNSRLWIWFGTYFKDEIAAMYRKLRTSNVYTAENIIQFIEANTSDIIGQSFYNKDGAIKYLTQVNEGVISNETIQRLQGCRECSYKQILINRLIFLDSFFDTSTLAKDKTRFNKLSLRSDAGDANIPIIISTYTPTYIKIIIGSGSTGTVYAYVDPNDYYELPTGGEVPGVMFNFPMDGNDKEIIIYGLESIVQIRNLDQLNLRKFDANEGIIKMTEINLSGSDSLNGFLPGASVYLRDLDLSSCPKLGSGTYAVPVINVEQCKNLERINLSNSRYVTGLKLPANSLLSYINFSNTNITALELDGLSFLTEENLLYANCNNMNSFKINNCSELQELHFDGYPALAEVEVTNCLNVKTISATYSILKNFNLTGTTNLKLLDLSNGTQWKTNYTEDNIGVYRLNLAAQENLEELNITNCGNNTTPILIVSPNNGFTKLKTFKANSSSLYSMCPTQTYYRSFFGKVDLRGCFSVVEGTNTLQIRNCTKIEQIKNLIYTGAVNSLFAIDGSGLKGNLASFDSCRVTSSNTSAASMFYNCRKLVNLNGLTLNLNTVTNADSCLNLCGLLSINDIRKVLQAMPNVTSLSSFRSVYGWSDSADGTLPGIAVPDNLFLNNTKIQNLSSFLAYNYITSIGGNLFNPIHYTSSGTTVYPLTNVSGMFSWLRSSDTQPSLNNGISSSLFSHDACKNITNMSNMFKGDQKFIGFKNSDNQITLEIPFPTGNKVSTMSQMFMNCLELQNSQDETNIKDFFKYLTQVTDITLIFAGQGSISNFITYIPDQLFENNKKLTSIAGAFSNIKSIETMGEYLFTSSNTTTHPNLTNASALFAGCSNLKGYLGSDPNVTSYHVPKNFFRGANNITSLGIYKYTWSSSTVCVKPGCFGNTALEGFDIDFLKPLKNLTNISFLFWKGENADTTLKTKNTGYNNDKLKAVIYTNSSTGVTGESLSGLVPNSLLSIYSESDTPKITDIRYLFAGNTNITGFGKINDSTGEYEMIVDSDEVTFLNPIKSSLIYAPGTFLFTGLSCDLPNNIFKGCTKLTNINSFFAECRELTGRIKYAKNALLEDDRYLVPPLFSGCTSLQNVAKLFYNCIHLDGTNLSDVDEAIPSNLFDSCRKVLQDVNNMFFGCTSLIGQFTPELPTLVVEGIYNAREIIRVDDEEVEYNIKLILNEPVELISGELVGSGQFNYALNEEGAEEFTRNISYTVDETHREHKNLLKFTTIDLANQSNDVEYTWHIQYAQGNYELSKAGAVSTDTFSTMTKVVSGTGAKQKFIVKRNGLLADCTSLTNTSGMFNGCSKLYGNIPEDLFFISSTSSSVKYNRLTNVSAMFKYCKNLGFVKSDTPSALNKEHVYNFDDPGIDDLPYLFPTDWIINCTALNNINELFWAVGNAANLETYISDKAGLNKTPGEEGEWKRPSLQIPNANPFRSTSIYTAIGTFGGMRILDNTALTKNFWQSSLNSITDTSKMFVITNIKNAGTSASNTLFSDSAPAKRLKNVSYMFYTRYQTFDGEGGTICFLNPATYSTTIVGSNKNKFLHQVERTVIASSNYTALDNNGYINKDSSNLETVNGIIGTFSNTEYNDNAIIS